MCGGGEGVARRGEAKDDEEPPLLWLQHKSF
jgi:hypothetical protein